MTTLFNQPLNVINVGIALFSDDLKKQHVPVTHLDWTPPGQGNMQVVEASISWQKTRWRRKSPRLTRLRWSALSSPIRCWWALIRRSTSCQG